MRTFPLGDNAITVEFGNEVSLELNQLAIALAEHFRSKPFAGLIEAVPAYASTTFFFSVPEVRENYSEFTTAYGAVKSIIEDAVPHLSKLPVDESRIIEIPMFITSGTAIDLDAIAEFSGLTSAEVISVFLERTYNVFMIGFLPGFAYMGVVDERIAMPRKNTPRTKVPKGNVAIGGSQTGVYPLESPGGWNVIGRTEMEMFDPNADPLCPLKAGDRVKFVRA
jgi:inhibitor of KinA